MLYPLVCAVAHSLIDVLLSRLPHHIAQLSHFHLTHFVHIRHFFQVHIRVSGSVVVLGFSQAELWLTFQDNPQGVSFFEIVGAGIWFVMVGLCYCSLVEFLLLIVHVAFRQAGEKLPTIVEFIDGRHRLG